MKTKGKIVVWCFAIAGALVALGWLFILGLSFLGGKNFPAAGGSSPLPAVSVDAVSTGRGGYRHEAVVRVSNEAAPQGFSVVGIQCAWVQDGRAIQANGTVALNVGYGQTVFVTVQGPEASKRLDSVSCRAEYANPSR